MATTRSTNGRSTPARSTSTGASTPTVSGSDAPTSAATSTSGPSSTSGGATTPTAGAAASVGGTNTSNSGPSSSRTTVPSTRTSTSRTSTTRTPASARSTTTRGSSRPASRTSPTRPTARASASAGAGVRGDTARAQAEVRVPLAEVRKPLYASVGAADLAVAKLRALPTTTGNEVRRISDRVGSLPVQAARVPVQVGTAVLALPGTVTSQISDLQGRATDLYNAWASRGERRVASLRRSPATEQAVHRTRTAVSQTRAARTTTRHAATAVGRAIVDAVPQN
ncbi:hypothetical protein MXD59_02875 [Frankia sp. Ag45/Mut15]|uniref:Uncharacterized protein n=1 Tax=Frankia umida TaxID=573489 RepID=A0ABT0JTL5_9ACTN|nr:hypothetical protein [Frankia umida]MCK9874735.1 hypothetical protein [Frankia umida]